MSKIKVNRTESDGYEEQEEAIYIPVTVIKPAPDGLEEDDEQPPEPVQSPKDEPKIKSKKQQWPDSKKKPRQNSFLKRVVGVLLICASVCLLALAALLVVNWYWDNSRIDELQNEFAEVEEVEGGENVNPPEDESNDYWDFINMPMINVNFGDLLRRNPDTVAWINIRSTNINYPVVQTSDNDYYLNHAFDKSFNKAGWVFADYRNNMVDFDKNTIIYGHSRYDGTMFGSLRNVLSDSWYSNKDNHVIRLSTPYENTMWQVFSTYQIDPETYYLSTAFSSEDSYAKFIGTIKSRSSHVFDIEVSSEDKIITISTCADALSEHRIVLHARLIKQQTR